MHAFYMPVSYVTRRLLQPSTYNRAAAIGNALPVVPGMSSPERPPAPSFLHRVVQGLLPHGVMIC